MSEERDREVDAAWRTASREEPAPALDERIRAEARRAVDAGPRAARRRRFRQLRYPFAAAATVALLAFGIAEMTPPDQVEPAVVSDQPAATPERGRTEQEAPSGPAAPPAGVAPSPEPAGISSAPSPSRNAAPPQAAPVPHPGVAAKRTPIPSAQEQAKSESLRDESGERFAPPPPGESPSGAPPQPRAAPAPADAATAKLAQSPAAESRRDTHAQAPEPQAPSATTMGEVRQRAAAAKLTHVDELKAKDAGAESVEAWVARIRELKASGQADAAAKELAKFRTAFGERADTLLPADLRAPASARP